MSETDERAERFREVCEYALGATRQAASMGKWERACRLIEREAALALGLPVLLGEREVPGIDGSFRDADSLREQCERR